MRQPESLKPRHAVGSASSRRCRSDGWTTERQLRFLDVLARTRSVSAAARAAGMSRESAYRLRARDPHGLFAAAWDRAVGADRCALTRAQVDEGHRRAIAAACGSEGGNLRVKPPHRQPCDPPAHARARPGSLHSLRFAQAAKEYPAR